MDFHAVLDWFFPAECANCEALGSGLCANCFAPPLALDRLRVAGLNVRVLGAYSGALRRAVLALKDGRRDVAQRFGDLLAPLAGSACLVPVPTTAARRRARGLDGAAAIARHIAERNGARVANVLDQVRGDSQRGRTRGERLQARGRFACRDPEAVRGLQITLLDDVVTTGSTLADCAEALRRAGAQVEDAIVVANASENVA